MITIKKITFATALGMFATFAYAATPPTSPPDISGTYKCTFHNPNPNTTTDGTEIVIIKKNGDTFNVKMSAPGETIPYNFGTAIFNKDINDAFSYVFWSITSSSTPATALYIIKPDGSLDGVYAGNGQVLATETCTKSS